jgi:hypothetical protein
MGFMPGPVPVLKDTTPQLDPGTVVRITEIVNPVMKDTLKLLPGMEGVVWYHNDVFRIDEDKGADPNQKGPAGEDLFYFELPGSKIRIGPIGKMPEKHLVVAWIVGGNLYQVTGLRPLFNGFLKWLIVRSGEVPRFRG